MNQKINLIIITATAFLRLQQISSENYVVAVNEYEITNQWGTKEVANGQFTDPSGLVVDSQGNVYVADFSAHSNLIQKFSNNRIYLMGWGMLGSDPGYFTSNNGMGNAWQ